MERLRGVTVAALALAVLLMGAYLGATLHDSSPAATAALFDEEQVVSLYQQASPAVVQVLASEREGTWWYRTPGGEWTPYPGTSSGTGFLVDREGYIVTNNHVVEGSSQVQVRRHDGRRLEARVVATAPGRDVALLKVDAAQVADITPLPLGDSDLVKPGQLAVVLGYPLDLGQTITVGVVSGVGRTVAPSGGPSLSGMIQTDAKVSPGNSGGPLLDVHGRVVGMVTAAQVDRSSVLGLERTGGMGFAIPSNVIQDLLPRLKQGQDVPRPWLGVQVVSVTPELKERLELPVGEGAYVVEVFPESPAAGAGLRGGGRDRWGEPTAGGDVVTALDGRATPGADALVAALAGKAPGDTVTLTVRRGEETLELRVTLGEWPEAQQASSRPRGVPVP